MPFDYAALSTKERRKVAHRVIARKAQLRGQQSSSTGKLEAIKRVVQATTER